VKQPSASIPPLVLFATGSTGGHVSPALAVAEALSESGRPVRTVFCGPAGGVAERLVASAGSDFVHLEIHPLRGEGAIRWLRGLANLPLGLIKSDRLLRVLKPDLVVGFGAHTSGPLLALAALRGIPTLLFEGNVDKGFANRCVGPLVHGAAVAWPQTLGAFPGREFLSGWPVRRAIREARPRDTPGTDRFHLLIMGGSAGSSALDRAARDALPHLTSMAGRLSVVHQASPTEVESLRENYRSAGVDARVEHFVADVAEHYQRASLVITRAGAATLAELAAVGLPSILVPLTAAGNHQNSNASVWEAAGCAQCIDGRELTGRRLADSILALAHDRAALERMRVAVKSWHRPDSASVIAAWCCNAMQSR